MPTVPYEPIPQAPQNVPVPYRTDRGATETAFGATIGSSMAGLGATVEQGGEKMFQAQMAQQEMVNTALITEGVLKGADKIGQLQADFHVLEGKNPGEAYKQYQTNLNAAVDDATQGASPAVARGIRQQLTRRVEFATTGGALHVAQQNRVYAKHMNEADNKLAVSDAGQSTDETAFQGRLKTIRDNHDKIAQGNVPGGQEQSPQQKTWDTEKDVSKAYYEYLFNMAATTKQPQKAMEYFKAHMGDIKDEDVRKQVVTMLDGAMRTQGVQNLADQITGGRSFQAQIFKRESGSDPKSVSDTGAKGIGQFLDSTWNDIRKKYPELQLSPAGVGQFRPEEVQRAEPVFRAENQAILDHAGITPTNKNTALAHYMGGQGAANFIKGMQSDPNQPATNLVPASTYQSPTNHAVFFDPSGRARSAAEVYSRQTAGFSDDVERPLTPHSDVNWLQQAEQKAVDLAEKAMPGDASFREHLLDGIRARYNKTKNDAEAADQDTYKKLSDFIDGGGNPQNRVTDIKALTANSDLYRMYLGLQDPGLRERLERQIGTNALKDYTPSESQKVEMKRLEGLAITDAAAFQKETGEGLTPGQQGDLRIKQAQARQTGMATKQLDVVLGDHLVKEKMRAAGLVAPKANEPPDKRYNEFIGEMNGVLRDYASTNNKPMPSDEYQEWVSKLAMKAGVQRSGGMFGLFQHERTVTASEVPDSFKNQKNAQGTPLKDIVEKALGRPMTDNDWGELYGHSMWHERQKGQRGG